MRPTFWRLLLACVLLMAMMTAPAWTAAVPKERMPLLSVGTVLGERPQPCPDIEPYTASRVEYDMDGDRDNGSEISAWFLSDRPKKPFIVALWAGDDRLDLEKIMVDLDRNGYADVVGQPGDEGIGWGPCEPAGVIVKAKRAAR